MGISGTIKIKFNTLKLLLHCCGNRKKWQFTATPSWWCRAKSLKQGGNEVMGRCFHFLLSFLLSISARENKMKIPLFLSQENLWNGREKDEGVWGFLHIKLYSVSFSLPSPYQAVSNRKNTDPKSNNPWENLFCFPQKTTQREEWPAKIPSLTHQYLCPFSKQPGYAEMGNQLFLNLHLTRELGGKHHRGSESNSTECIKR